MALRAGIDAQEHARALGGRHEGVEGGGLQIANDAAPYLHPRLSAIEQKTTLDAGDTWRH